EGAVVYVPKEEARRLVTQQIEPEEILGKAVIFARQGEHRAKLDSHPASTPSPEARAPTHQQPAATSPQDPASMTETAGDEKKAAPLQEGQGESAKAKGAGSTQARQDGLPLQEGQGERAKAKGEVATQARQDSLRLKEQAPAPLLEAQQ